MLVPIGSCEEEEVVPPSLLLIASCAKGTLVKTCMKYGRYWWCISPPGLNNMGYVDIRIAFHKVNSCIKSFFLFKPTLPLIVTSGEVSPCPLHYRRPRPKAKPF